MPSRRHSSEMLSSPRRPSSTMRILSSAEKCRRVARRMSLIASSAGALSGPDFCLIFAPCGYDDPEILPTRNPQTDPRAMTTDSGLGSLGMWGFSAEEAERRIAGFQQLSGGSLNVNYPLWPEPRITADVSEPVRAG